MPLKLRPKLLYDICLLKVSHCLLTAWLSWINTQQNSACLKHIFAQYLPPSIVDKLVYVLVELHARKIQISQNKEQLPSVTCLLRDCIAPHLRVLNLNYLRHLGAVHDEEIQHLHHVLLEEIPLLKNLAELYLQTGGFDITLPICNNDILRKVGENCQHLRVLDISYNSTVGDVGLEYLIPGNNWPGCPLLEKIFLFECSISSYGVAELLKGLPNLKTLGYKETCAALQTISKGNFITKLDHINNLGSMCRTFKDFCRFRCSKKVTLMIKKMCPDLKALKIRVVDDDVVHLKSLTNLVILELVYNVGIPTSPGDGTEQFLKFSGSQLESLSLVCSEFSSNYLQTICLSCKNLQRLWIKCYKFIYIETLASNKCILSNLKVFSLTVGDKYVNDFVCNVPYNVFSNVLQQTSHLRELIIAMKSTQLNDDFINNLLNSIDVNSLKYLSILTPDKNITRSSLNITMASVEKIVNHCPNLSKLGNLLVWNVDYEDVQEFREKLKSSNSALTLVYKFMIV